MKYVATYLKGIIDPLYFSVPDHRFAFPAGCVRRSCDGSITSVWRCSSLLFKRFGGRKNGRGRGKVCGSIGEYYEGVLTVPSHTVRGVLTVPSHGVRGVLTVPSHGVRGVLTVPSHGVRGVLTVPSHGVRGVLTVPSHIVRGVLTVPSHGVRGVLTVPSHGVRGVLTVP